VTFDVFDVVVVPFPFTDRTASRRRPALIVSVPGFGHEIGHSVFAMITGARKSTWPFDVPLTDLVAAGLKVECVARMKLFTLDHRLVLRRTGRLAERDASQVREALGKLFGTEQPLAELLAGVRPDNLHGEIDMGPAGR
jgi:mRNA interferase MazF